MSRAAGRMADGRVQAKAGTRTAVGGSRQTRAPGRWDAGSQAKLLRYLAKRPEAERDAIRAHLTGDGSEKALGLLAELERRWEDRPC